MVFEYNASIPTAVLPLPEVLRARACCSTGVTGLLWDIYKWKTSGPKLRITTNSGMIGLVGYGQATGDEEYICVWVTNVGKTRTTITTLGFSEYGSWWQRRRLKRIKSGLVLQPLAAKPLPHSIDVGEQWAAACHQSEYLTTILNKGKLWCEIYHSWSSRPVLAKVETKQNARPRNEHLAHAATGIDGLTAHVNPNGNARSHGPERQRNFGGELAVFNITIKLGYTLLLQALPWPKVSWDIQSWRVSLQTSPRHLPGRMFGEPVWGGKLGGKVVEGLPGAKFRPRQIIILANVNTSCRCRLFTTFPWTSARLERARCRLWSRRKAKQRRLRRTIGDADTPVIDALTLYLHE
jgi:hypothetical protein